MVDAGTVAVGGSADVEVSLGAAFGTVQVVSAEVAGDFFSLLDTELPAVDEGDAAALRVRYAPTEEGWHTATLRIETDEPRDAVHEVTLRGHAAEADARVWPLVVDFGPVEPGGLGTGWFVVDNQGAAPVEVLAATVSDGDFSVGSSLPLTVQAGTEQVISVSFEPDDDAPAGATLLLDAGGVVVFDPITLRGNDCATASGELYDWDGDGYGYCGSDCDDWDGGVHPGATETCDGVDEDCDGQVDEGTSCVDDDGDGWSEDEGDCDDADAAISPGADEVPGNGIDDDCDGVTDDGTLDADGDGFATSGGDCDDGDASVHPGAAESANGVDDDCDGQVDEGTSASDDDGDGYSEDEGDCDDTDASMHPGATETADWRDEDCDGTVDEGTRYADDDGDGWTEYAGDCDDDDASVNPGAVEVSGNGVDDDCDGVTE